MWPRARRPDARRARRRRSSTRKASRLLKKGRCARPAGLRRGQEDHGPQAPHACRQARPLARRECSARRHSRPRRGGRSVAAGAAALSLHRAHLCRGRIPGAENGHNDAATGCWTIEIVRPCDLHRFAVLPKRWFVDHRTMLPVWALNGPHLLNVRAVDDRLLFPGSSGERVDLSQANQSRHKF